MQNQVHELTQFRHELYRNLNKRADPILELVDAISCQTNVSSVAELSLTEQFTRQYSSLYAAIAAAGELDPLLVARLAAQHLTLPSLLSFWLLAVDVTAHPRIHAHCLADRGYVYQGTKPRVTVGHQYSSVACLPESVGSTWMVPLLAGRVATAADKELVGAEQVRALLDEPGLPFSTELTVLVGDSYYSKPAFLAAVQSPNLVVLARCRSDRAFYLPAVPEPGRRGRQKVFGHQFMLRDSRTWPEPTETWQTTFTSYRKQLRRVTVTSWSNILMRGKRKPVRLPMEKYPFNLVRVHVTSDQGEEVYKRPLWILVMGDRRAELSLEEIFVAFRQRFQQEHGFRFLKQRLLLTAYQTPDVNHEETWWQLVQLAYLQLWVARSCAHHWPKPWQRYLPIILAGLKTPSVVQSDLGRILRQLDHITHPVKRRGNAPGRTKGARPPPRKRHPVVRKG
jgi:hypothetical protein